MPNKVEDSRTRSLCVGRFRVHLATHRMTHQEKSQNNPEMQIRRRSENLLPILNTDVGFKVQLFGFVHVLCSPRLGRQNPLDISQRYISRKVPTPTPLEQTKVRYQRRL